MRHDCEVNINLSCVTDRHHFARVDAFVPRESHECIIEIDEDQHKTRMLSCENRRMNDATGAIRCRGNERPILWIRYNPDAFRIDRVLQKLPRKDRLSILIHVILSHVPTSHMEILYLFYDTDAEGTPLICNDPDYDNALKPCVRIRKSNGLIVGIPLDSDGCTGTGRKDRQQIGAHKDGEHECHGAQEQKEIKKEPTSSEEDRRSKFNQQKVEHKREEKGRPITTQKKSMPNPGIKYTMRRDDQHTEEYATRYDRRPVSNESVTRRWIPFDYDDDIIIRKHTAKC